MKIDVRWWCAVHAAFGLMVAWWAAGSLLERGVSSPVDAVGLFVVLGGLAYACWMALGACWPGPGGGGGEA